MKTDDMMIRRELKHGNEREVDSFDSGHCIFSSSPRGFQKQDGYTGVQKKFNSDDRPAEVRCYFGQKVGEERAKVAFCARRGSRAPPDSFVVVSPSPSGRSEGSWDLWHAHRAQRQPAPRPLRDDRQGR